MKDKKGILLLFIGLLFIAIGSYMGFEEYGNYLSNKDGQALYTGVYKSKDSKITITEASKKNIDVLIGNISYKFVYDGEYYTNKALNLSLKIEDSTVTFIEDSKEKEFYYKEK